MASINTGNAYTQSYGGGYIANRVRNESKEAEKKEETVEKTTPELEAYKQKFLEKIRALVDKPELANTKISIDINSAAFEKMRTDSAYEKKILDLFQAKTDKKYPLPPVSIDLTANAEGESAEIDYGQSGELFGNRRILAGMQRSLLRGGVESMREGVLSSLQTRFGKDSKLDMGSLAGALQDLDLYA